METIKIDINEIKLNPSNPRTIKDDKFKKLVKSIKSFPEMLKIRPIVVNEDKVILGGNMRYKACKEAGLKEIYIIEASELTDDQKKEFIVKDNIGYGEWDFDYLIAEWDKNLLVDWGLDLPIISEEENTEDNSKYTKKIDTPIYEPKNEKPKINTIYDIDKYKELVEKIESSSVDNNIKDFLKIAASRHIVFNYEKIADFYANSDRETQDLMEQSALVIIDFDKAIENGFVSLSDKISKLYQEDYGNEI